MSKSMSSSPCLPPNHQSNANTFSSMPPPAFGKPNPLSSSPNPDAPPIEFNSNQNLAVCELDPAQPPEQQPWAVPAQAAVENDAAANSNPETIISKVEAVIESVIDSMLHKQPELAIPIRVKKKQQQPRSSVGMNSSSSSSLPVTAAPAIAAWTRVLVRFPGRDGRESWRFS